MRRFRFLIALVFVAAPAFADAVYSYTGAPFDTELGSPLYLANPTYKLGESIDLLVDFPAPIAPGLVHQPIRPASWSLKVGMSDFASSDISLTLGDSFFSTDSSGKIDDWSFSVFFRKAPIGFSTSGTSGDEAHYVSVSDGIFAGEASTKKIGNWTGPAAVPEPSSLSLLITGLAALFFHLKRRSRA